MGKRIIIIFKENYINLLIILALFLISFFSGTLAQPLLKHGYKALAIVLWVIYGVSVISIFLVTHFLLSFSKSFYMEGKNAKFWTYFALLLIAFIIYTIIFIIIHFISPLSFLNFANLSGILLAIVSSAVLGITLLLTQ